MFWVLQLQKVSKPRRFVCKSQGEKPLVMEVIAQEDDIVSSIIGIISDTHGTLSNKVNRIFEGCEMIIHAGDIGNIQVIDALTSIAPVLAIRGNIDKKEWAEKFPVSRAIKIENLNIYVLHDLKEIPFDPAVEGFDIIISGHSHIYTTVIKDKVLYINPGGAGKKRFNLPLTVALLIIDQGTLYS